MYAEPGAGPTNAYKHLSRKYGRECLNYPLLANVSAHEANEKRATVGRLIVMVPVEDVQQLQRHAELKPCASFQNVSLVLVTTRAATKLSESFDELYKCFGSVRVLHLATFAREPQSLPYLRALLSDDFKLLASQFEFLAWVDTHVSKLTDYWLDVVIRNLPVHEYTLVKMQFPFQAQAHVEPDFSPIILASGKMDLLDLISKIVHSEVPQVPNMRLGALLSWFLFNDSCNFKKLSFAIEFADFENVKRLNEGQIVAKFRPTNSNTLRSRSKILVAIVFGGKQLNQVFAAVQRWQSEHVRPCSQITDDFGVLFVQSDPDEVNNSTRVSVLDFVQQHADAVRCFSKIHFSFVKVAFDDYFAGPAPMFREIILGNYSKGYDFAFQMEPDILPIRAMWLERLHAETSRNFWVKGSAGIYFDSVEADVAYITTVGTSKDAIIIGPVGHRILHINGNALYSLSRQFREVIRKFYDNVEARVCNFPCPHRKHRMECVASRCFGSFDTTLIEFLMTVEPLPSLFSYYYVYSPFVINGVSGIPIMKLPDSTLFVHKPWRSNISQLFTHEEFKSLREELEKIAN